MNSREKGKRGERELAAWLSERGYPATRGAQHRGGPGSPDVVCAGLSLHFEVKRCEALRLHEAMAQAVRDAGAGKLPVVAHRRNGGAWLAVLRLVDLLRLLPAVEPEPVRHQSARDVLCDEAGQWEPPESMRHAAEGTR